MLEYQLIRHISQRQILFSGMYIHDGTAQENKQTNKAQTTVIIKLTMFFDVTLPPHLKIIAFAKIIQREKY